MISDERIERAMEAYRVNGSSQFQGFCYGRRHVIRDLNLPAGKQEIWSTDDSAIGYDSAHKLMMRELERIRMRAALTADAPEIAAAEIRGLEMAKEIAVRRAIRNDCCVKREDEAAEIADDILARIAELKDKPEPTGCK